MQVHKVKHFAMLMSEISSHNIKYTIYISKLSMILVSSYVTDCFSNSILHKKSNH